MSVMLYKNGGKHKFHGGDFSYIIVDELEVDRALEEGWTLTTTEAKEAAKPETERGSKTIIESYEKDKNVVDDSSETELKTLCDSMDIRCTNKNEIKEHLRNHVPLKDTNQPTREELKTKATELEISFDSKISTKKLGELVSKKLAE